MVRGRSCWLLGIGERNEGDRAMDGGRGGSHGRIRRRSITRGCRHARTGAGLSLVPVVVQEPSRGGKQTLDQTLSRPLRTRRVSPRDTAVHRKPCFRGVLSCRRRVSGSRRSTLDECTRWPLGRKPFTRGSSTLAVRKSCTARGGAPVRGPVESRARTMHATGWNQKGNRCIEFALDGTVRA